MGDSPRQRETSVLSLPLPSGVGSGEADADLDSVIRMLEEEKKKSEKLRQINERLKDQLAEAHQTNESLTNDLQKITSEWEALREELILKEDEWRDEEHAFNEYYTAEHGRLLMLWRDVVCVKRMYAEMQMNTERDLNRLKDGYAVAAREFARACSGVNNTAALSAHCEVLLYFFKRDKTLFFSFYLFSVGAASTAKGTRNKRFKNEIRRSEGRKRNFSKCFKAKR